MQKNGLNNLKRNKMKLINNPHFKASITLLIISIIISLFRLNPETMFIAGMTLFVIAMVGCVYTLLYHLFNKDV